MEDAKIRAKWKVEDLKIKVSEHKDEIIGWTIIAAPIVLGSATEIYKAHAKASVAKEERVRRDYTVYDPSSGFYYTSKKPLDNRMKQEIDRRHTQNGERYGDIMEDMGLFSKKKR